MKHSLRFTLRLMSVAIVLCFLVVASVVGQTQKPTPQPTPKPTPRRPLPKLSNGARGFDSKSRDSTARFIAIGGGYGAGEDEEPLPKLKRRTALGYYQLGNELYNRGKMNEAISALETAVKLNPNYVNAYWRLGNAYAEYNNLVDESKFDNQECFRRAIVAFEHVKRLQPRRAGAYNNLGVLYFNTGEFAKAVAAFQSGLRLKARNKENDVSLMEGGTLDDLDLYVFVGDAYEMLGKYDLALEFYQRANREESGRMAGLINARVGRLYEKLGDTEKAIAAYEAIDLTHGYYDMDAVDTSADIRVRMGLLYALKRDFERAVLQLSKAIEGLTERLKTQKESGPTDAESQESEALWLDEVQTTKSLLASAAYNLGVVYLSMNRTSDAVAAFQKAIDFEPNSVEARFNLGFAYHSLGNIAAARAEVDALQKIDIETAKELEQLISK